MLNDNENKLFLIDKINSCVDKIEQNIQDDTVKNDIISTLNSVSLSIKESYHAIKSNLNKVNSQTKQIEEANNRIRVFLHTTNDP